MTVRYGSSLRERSLSETLALAEAHAPSLGVVRVTEVTRLDRLGIPSYASIRPEAAVGALHVSAGKGFTRDEAKAGAFMEGIEQACAEPERALPFVPVETVRVRELLDGAQHGAFLLAPRAGRHLDPDAPIEAVRAEDVVTGERVLVPAQLVFFPWYPRPSAASYYISDTNGLCSGNTLAEATVHGLCELVERDVSSFHNVRDGSRLVTGPLPPLMEEARARAAALGMTLSVRALENPYDIAHFTALLHQPDAVDGVHMGIGCHPLREVALARAITEAAQTRLGIIHGGRDDLTPDVRFGANTPESERGSWEHRFAVAHATEARPLRFEEVPDHPVDDVRSAFAFLHERLARVGLQRVLRVVLSDPALPFVVLRVIVPGLENFKERSDRAGPRLSAFTRRLHPDAG